MQVREVEGPALVSAPPRLVSFAYVPPADAGEWSGSPRRIEDHLGSFRVECWRLEVQGYISAFRFPHPPTPGQDREDPVPSFLLPWLPCRSLVIHSSPPPTGPQLESYLVPPPPDCPVS